MNLKNHPSQYKGTRGPGARGMSRPRSGMSSNLESGTSSGMSNMLGLGSVSWLLGSRSGFVAYAAI